jgi:hypothetical protein
VDIPVLVASVSPTFIEISRQVAAAEAASLNQLVGIGLRKALEFLVKDFASAEHPDREAEIKAVPLAQCIRTYIDDPRVKAVAERAAWLGNDETHYVRRWEDKDIRDLKVLVQLAVNWIHNHLLTNEYIKTMERS